MSQEIPDASALPKRRVVFVLKTSGILRTCFGRDSRPEPTASWQPYPHPTLTSVRCSRRRVRSSVFPTATPQKKFVGEPSLLQYHRKNCRQHSCTLFSNVVWATHISTLQKKFRSETLPPAVPQENIDVVLVLLQSCRRNFNVLSSVEIHEDARCTSGGIWTTCGNAHRTIAFFEFFVKKKVLVEVYMFLLIIFDVFWILRMLTTVNELL